MREFKHIWIVGLLITLMIVILPIVLFASPEQRTTEDPWTNVPVRPPHTDHSELLDGPYENAVHWTWESEPIMLPGRDEPVTIGKKNQINNFCIGIQGNWTGCTRCHAGYGWDDADFDFGAEENVDCLVCHEQTGTYAKSNSGLPADSVDLAMVAQSVATPTRLNCGGCHFNGGGGNAVKHGDLDSSLFYPSGNVDVHMGRYDFQCVDCHTARDHQIRGHMISVSSSAENQISCTGCHGENLHDDDRINAHLDTVACQTCHIPAGAVRDATKMYWDWSAAGQDLPEDPHSYLKIKGSFVYEQNFTPEYYWFNGEADRYILGDQIDPTQTTALNMPLGGIADQEARIWPFKVHRASQLYDTRYDHLLQPKTVGDGGYWTEFDWDLAARLGAEASGIDYSGEYGFADTEMYWALTHMIAPKEDALQCSDCHGDSGRLDWESLGYFGDPMRWGNRVQTIGLVTKGAQD
jgi:octaheme c-type cytochrome (tetrathionate reductase family)